LPVSANNSFTAGIGKFPDPNFVVDASSLMVVHRIEHVTFAEQRLTNELRKQTGNVLVSANPQ
jgi:hypothetical protein